ncbi:heme-binding protein [Candidatus Pelagibacter sp.]|nr:heme-binding protein [Candidatus Pelagibacter sp.]
MIKIFSIIFLSLIIASKVMAYEEANYEVVKKNEIYEIRKYSDRLAIETEISNQGSSFRKLFNYISGNNENKEEISMTTPVIQVEKKGSMTMQFYLPSKFNKDNIPSPSNSDVKILNIKGGYYAVIKYSGRASDKNFIKHKDILKDELKKIDILILSSPIKATYDKPFTLPILRRNEAMFKIDINL